MPRITCECGQCFKCKHREAVRRIRLRRKLKSNKRNLPWTNRIIDIVSEFPNFDFELASFDKYRNGRRSDPRRNSS